MVTLVELAQTTRNLWLAGYTELEVLKGVSEMRNRPAGAGTMAQETYRRLEAKLASTPLWTPERARDR